MSFCGKLNKLIVIQVNTPTQNSCNELIDSWATFATVYAEELSNKVSERFLGDQYAGFSNVNWRIRYLSGVTNLMRISYNSVIYDIEGVSEVGRKEQILVTKAVL